MGPHECFLGDVVGFGETDEPNRQAPCDLLMTPHELRERVDVTSGCGNDEIVIGSEADVIHQLRSGRPEHGHVGTSPPSFDDG